MSTILYYRSKQYSKLTLQDSVQSEKLIIGHLNSSALY